MKKFIVILSLILCCSFNMNAKVPNHIQEHLNEVIQKYDGNKDIIVRISLKSYYLNDQTFITNDIIEFFERYEYMLKYVIVDDYGIYIYHFEATLEKQAKKTINNLTKK